VIEYYVIPLKETFDNYFHYCGALQYEDITFRQRTIFKNEEVEK